MYLNIYIYIYIFCLSGRDYKCILLRITEILSIEHKNLVTLFKIKVLDQSEKCQSFNLHKMKNYVAYFLIKENSYYKI